MNDRFTPIVIERPTHLVSHIPAPRPQHLDEPRAQPCFEGMDDLADYAQTLPRVRPADPDDVFSERDDLEPITDAERLEDTMHDMRVEWQFALDNQHQLSTPKLPTVVAGKLVMVPVTELVGTLMETCRAVELLCETLRTGDLTRLHLHLRQDWIDGDAQELAAMGWAA